MQKKEQLLRMNALLPPDRNDIAVILRFGRSRYTPESRRDCETVVLDGQPQKEPDITLIDNSQNHRIVFSVWSYR